MTFLAFAPRAVWTLFASLSVVLLLAAGAPATAIAQVFRGGTPRIAVVSAFAPQLELLKGELQDRSGHSATVSHFFALPAHATLGNATGMS